MKFHCLCLFLLLTTHVLAGNPEIYPVIDTVDEFVSAPYRFRRAQDPYTDVHCIASRKGLDQLKLSGSKQFSEKQLHYLLQTLPEKNLIFVDLRREFHGFLNGYPVSWELKEPIDYSRLYEYNEGLNVQQIEKAEKLLLEEELINEEVEYETIWGALIPLHVVRVETERELVEKMGCRYIRFPVMDAQHPLDQEVDAMISFIKALPADSWVHAHCAGGKGRTTTFMCLLDIMKNHSILSVDEIMRRQTALGGFNLIDQENIYANYPELMARGIERREFIRLFYNYCVENPHFEEMWSSWHARKNQMHGSPK